MSWRRSYLQGGLAAATLAALLLLAQPAPPEARANPACDLGASIGAIGGGLDAIGAGNPVGDVCNAVTDGAIGVATKPLTGAIEGLGHGVLDQITTWVSDGAVWLIKKVASGIESSTTPRLTAKAFLAEYRTMAEIAAVLAAAMLLLAVVEAVARGSWGLLGRVLFVNLPLAFLATSVAFAVVQLLLVATDGLCQAVAASAEEDSRHFFKEAIGSLAKAGADGAAPPGSPGPSAAGAVSAPLFVTFLAAIVGAFAAFFVWVELLMRDAAVYVVSLFMPLSLAASIWPRWTGALRRTAELEVVVIGSKFVIVSIIALAAGLAANGEGGIEPLLAATALMLLACFAPFMLLKLVPFAEGAMTAAYGRRSASGGAVGGLHLAHDARMLRNLARSNWGPPEVWGVKPSGSGSSDSGGGPGGSAAAGPAGSPSKPPPGPGSGSAAGKKAGPSAAGAAAGSPAAAAGAASTTAAKGSRSAAERLTQTDTSRAADGSEAPASAARPASAKAAKGAAGSAARSDDSGSAPAGPNEKPVRPPKELSAKSPGKERK